MTYISKLTPKSTPFPNNLTYLLPGTKRDFVLGVAGHVMLVDSDGDEIKNLGSAGAGGGGNNTWSNAQGDFTATITASTKNITIAGLSWTFNWRNVVLGMIQVKQSDGTLGDPLEYTGISVSGGVITLVGVDNFAAGDEVVVTLFGRDKAYEKATDADRVTILNSDAANYTSSESVAASNLGFTGGFDGTTGATAIFTDTGETYIPASVAEGYKIYNVTDGSDATAAADTLSGLAGDGGAGSPTADDITHSALTGGTGDDWQPADIASIPEVKRFVIPAEGFNKPTFDTILDSQNADNSCYFKLYRTNNPNANDTDDTYWHDITNDAFGVAEVTADGIGGSARAVTMAFGKLTTHVPVLKYMMKFVGVSETGVADNEFNVYVKKSS